MGHPVLHTQQNQSRVTELKSELKMIAAAEYGINSRTTIGRRIVLCIPGTIKVITQNIKGFPCEALWI